MMRRVYSYVGIFAYLYEHEYKLGKVSDIIVGDIFTHYLLVSNSMMDVNHRKKVLADLSDNWSDVLQIIFNFHLEPNSDEEKITNIEPEIKKVTNAIEKVSGKKCKEPKNPLSNVPKKVLYNPFKITEDLSLSRGHSIPDISSVFAQELLPQLLATSSNEQQKEIVFNYTINLIKSYYDNAGYVPMVIIEQITGQISQVVYMAGSISFSPYTSLKEFILSKIYRVAL